METIAQKITRLKTNGYELSFEEVFNKAFENYKKIAIYAGFAILVLGFLTVVIASAGLITYFGVENINEKSILQLEAKLLLPENIAYRFLFVVILNSLLSPFSAGFLKMSFAADRDIAFKMRHFLSFYKWTYFKELFAVTFVITVLSTGIDSVLTLFKIPLLGVIISFSIGILTVLSTPLIIFGNQKGLEALKASVSLSSKQFMNLFLLLLVAFFGSLVGLIGFCIGIFFTIPFTISMQFAIYHSIIGFENENEIKTENH
jgi:hypothetical protein